MRLPGHYPTTNQAGAAVDSGADPPVESIRATLTSSRLSRVVIGGDIFRPCVQQGPFVAPPRPAMPRGLRARSQPTYYCLSKESVWTLSGTYNCPRPRTTSTSRIADADHDQYRRSTTSAIGNR